MKLKIIISLLVSGTIAIVYSQNSVKSFAPAADFPRGAIIYTQFTDLSAFVKLWNESQLKQNYLESENFAQFENSHLALKLASRWQEFCDAGGFSIDLDAISSISETRAAIAVYDIGRLDLVFIAPVNDEIFAASQFFQNQSQFEQTKLEDGTVFYSKNVEADRGRQKQKIVFANTQGRFILATSEKLLFQTLATISGKNVKSSLAAEPAFKVLSEKVKPHTATVWVDQAKLNDDYYFKHYWLSGNVEDLKKFRAGMFDFEINDEKWTERREFLLTEKQSGSTEEIDQSEAKRLSAMLPDDIPFYKLQTAANNPGLVNAAVQNTLFDSLERQHKTNDSSRNRQSFGYENFYSSKTSYRGDYSYLDNDYDKTIDDAEDAGITEETDDSPQIDRKKKIADELQTALAPALPQFVLTAQQPEILSAPLFAEFRKAAILTLRAPQNVNREKLETALAEKLKNQLTIADSAAVLNWETKTENNQQWRELNLPMLGWGISYAFKNDRLIFSNNAELLKSIIFSEKKPVETPVESRFDELTVIRPGEHRQFFEQLMGSLAGENTADPASDFFAGNIGSLLNIGSDVSRIEINRKTSAANLHEEINIIFKPESR